MASADLQVSINKLSVEGFKGNKTIQSWSFGQHVEIIGDNYTGKTSLAEAIVYAFTGQNLEGSNRTDSLVTLGGKAMRVTLGFTGVDGKQHEVIRSKAAKGGKLLLDGIEASQVQLERLLGPCEAFLASFWPSSLGAMKDSEARDFFLRLISPPAWEEIAGQLLPEERQCLIPFTNRQDMDDIVRELRAELRRLEDEGKKTEGTREAYGDALKQLPPEAIDSSALEAELAQFQEELARLSIAPQLIDMEGLSVQLQAARHRYETLEMRIPSWNIEPGSLCPTCQQQISQEHVDSVKAEIDRSTTAIRQDMADAISDGKRIKAELERVRTENERVRQEFFTAGHERRKQLQARASELQTAIQEANRQNARRGEVLRQSELAKSKLAGLEQIMEEDSKAQAKIRAEIGAVTQFSAKRAEIMAGELQRGLKRASIQLFDVVKSTGEIKPVFRLLYDKKPFAVLSTSERVRLGLEISSLVKQLAEVKYPTFIDNAESITDYEDPRGQLFVSKVVKGQALTITNKDREAA